MSPTWDAVLDDLERRVTQAELLLAHAGESEAPDEGAAALDLGEDWDDPQALGPLPATLIERARALAGRQDRVVRGLSAAADGRRKQAKLVDTMKFDGAADPVYLDQAG